jgi:magnesium transporter
MLTGYIRNGEGRAVEASLEEALWVRAEEPSREEITKLVEIFGLEESLLTDALDPFEAPRLEVEGDHVYLFLRYAFSRDPHGTTPLLIIHTPRTCITVAIGTPSFIDRFATSRVLAESPAGIVVRLIADITARYHAVVVKIQRNVNRRKQKLTDMSESDLVDFAVDEDALNSFTDALVPQSAVLSAIIAKKTIPISEEELEHAEDTLLSTRQLIELSNSTLDTVRSVRETHAAISNLRLNKIIRVLTALTILVTIPNVITGFYGMNLSLPFSEYPHTAGIVLFGIVTAVIATGWYFWKNKWV